MTTVVIIVGVVVATATVAWFLANRQHPENASGHDDRPAETTSEKLYGKSDRPAGPDATTMDPDQLGGDHRPPPVGPTRDEPARPTPSTTGQSDPGDDGHVQPDRTADGGHR